MSLQMFSSTNNFQGKSPGHIDAQRRIMKGFCHPAMGSVSLWYTHARHGKHILYALVWKRGAMGKD